LSLDAPTLKLGLPKLNIDQLAQATVGRETLSQSLDWMLDQTFSWPVQFVAKQDPFATAADIEALRMRSAFTQKRPTSARLPFTYTKVPPFARKHFARLIGRLQRARQTAWAKFPRWPIDLSVDALADFSGVPTVKIPVTPVLVSHDIDSPEGLRNLVRQFLPIEERFGCRSANYIVPCAWPIDHGLVAEAYRRGHEIGIHGYDHSNRTAFAASEERIRRLEAGLRLAYQYEGIGYRAPSLVRTRELIEDLEGYYRYDSSIPTSGGPFPVPNNGCASARPWRFRRMWELPLTMPRDGSLRFLGYSPDQILAMWKSSAECIARSGGIVFLLTHCESRFSGNPAMLAIFQAFLEWCADNSQMRFCRPRDLIDELDQSVDDGANL
jgi:peptidoglycan/xylan/chitin deacetylase (PgdA/CDA1 family)